ncbi:putative exosome complex exonuclease RRP43 [Triangularia verruculosa]|uniref:Ribosomal RNA-processing protein 43 n=1 Tax=Triangularia verruculosa TaxID=2587418 RepID=A0AAN6XH50_9PEZI|nr:putative exosome complex exonuclease RRP43 [Triangularia verruculosa]
MATETASTGAPPPSLTFTRPVFAKLSPHPYLLRTLSPDSPDQQPTRNNGRAPHQSRPIQINTSSLSQAHGSSLVRTGDTTVICGVRGELLPVTSIPQFRPHNGTLYDQDEDDEARARKELKDYDLLVPNIELATGCAPQFLPGVPPTTLAQTLSTRVYSLLHGTGVVDGRELRIWYTPETKKEDGDDMEVEGEEEEEEQKPEVVAYWVLYIDLLFVSFDGNPFDAAWAAVLAALRDTKLPFSRWDPDREMVVCRKGQDRKLSVRGLPVSCSAAVFLEKEHAEVGKEEGNRHWILLDPDRSEEGLCKEVITVVVDCSEGGTRVRGIEKQGGTVVGRELIRGFIGVAEGRWREVKEAMGN